MARGEKKKKTVMQIIPANSRAHDNEQWTDSTFGCMLDIFIFDPNDGKLLCGRPWISTGAKNWNG